MKLVSFSVENYRSITTARKIPLADYSLLVGANNEGKSNILHALTLAMNELVDWRRQVRHTTDGRTIRSWPGSRSRRYGKFRYDWDTDFPVSKQRKGKLNGVSNVVLEFELDEIEIEEFKSVIGSNLNGTLPLSVSFGQGSVDVTVKKPGRGGVTLTKKRMRIAEFVSKRIRFEYIPAIRTAESADQVNSQLVERELFRLEDNEDYANALAKIDELQQPVFDELAQTIQSTVSSFLPNVKSVELKSHREDRYRALRRAIDIEIDDGQLTRLERKGDGVQSLVALALMRHASQQGASGLSTVIAIEEPESHLHPRAVHELRAVIETLSENNQVVLTSHSPLFVKPHNLKNTIIVKASRAACAAHVAEIREALGVRFSDNLENARLVLLVEGASDAKALRAILARRSEKLAIAFRSGIVALDYLGGASGLRQKATFYKSSACMIQCFIDNDKEGELATRRAIDEKVLNLRDVNLASVPHLPESELEDLYDVNCYRSAFLEAFGVDPKRKTLGKTKLKWSNAMERRFRETGEPWSDRLKFEIKEWLAEFASTNCEQVVNELLSGPLTGFIETSEEKLPQA